MPDFDPHKAIPGTSHASPEQYCPPVVRTAYTLHRENCAAVRQSTYSGTCEWAKGMTIEDARDMMRWHGLRECQRCFPLMVTVPAALGGFPLETT